MHLRHVFALLTLASALLPASHVSSLDARASIARAVSLQPRSDLATLKLVGHLGGNTTTTFVRGGYAYVGVGPELDILDISQPAHPTRVAYLTLPDVILITDLVVDSHYAYLIAGETLYVVDIASSAVPRLIGRYTAPQARPLPDQFLRLAVADGYAYITAGLAGMHIVDLSHPDAPIRVSTNDPIGFMVDVAVAGHHAYVADEVFGLRVVDVADHAAPKEVGHLSRSDGAPRSLAVAGQYVYASYTICPNEINEPCDPVRYERFSVIDISNPAVPAEVGAYIRPHGWGATELVVADEHAYLMHLTEMLIVNVADPTDPVEVGTYTPSQQYGPSRELAGVAVDGHSAYVANLIGLQVVDITDPAVPREQGFFGTPPAAENLVLAGRYLYANYDDYLLVLDVATLAFPTQVGALHLPGQQDISDLAVSGTYAYAVGNGGLRVVRITDPAAPVEVGAFSGVASAVAVADHYAYLATGQALRIVDIANPAAPIEVGTFPSTAQGITVAGHYAYLADGTAGLRIVDVADPRAPKTVGVYNTPGEAQDIAVLGRYAYLADGTAGLRIVDVADPALPREVGAAETEDALHVAVDGNQVYVAGGQAVWLADVASPAHPIRMARYEAGIDGGIRSVAVAHGYGYAGGTRGLFIVRYPMPTGAIYLPIVRQGMHDQVFAGSTGRLQMVGGLLRELQHLGGVARGDKLCFLGGAEVFQREGAYGFEHRKTRLAVDRAGTLDEAVVEQDC